MPPRLREPPVPSADVPHPWRSLTPVYGRESRNGWKRETSAELSLLDSDLRAGADLLEDGRIANDLSEDVDGAGGPDLAAPAHRRGAEEDAEGGAGRPVAEVAQIDGLTPLLELGLHGNGEVDLVAPCLAGHAQRERLPDGPRRIRVVQDRVGRDGAGRDAYASRRCAHELAV